MSRFARFNRGLKDLFTPSAADFLQPSEVSEDVSLIHPAFGPLHDYSSVEISQEQGALGATILDFTTVPADRVWWTHLVHVFHDDPAARQLNIMLFQSNTSLAVHYATTGQEGGGAAVAANIPFHAERSVLIPPTWNLRFTASSMAAGQRLTAVVMRREFNLADWPPGI